MYLEAKDILQIFAIFVINLTLGLLALIRNSTNPINRLMFLISLSISLWASTSAISDSTRNFHLSEVTSSLAFSTAFVALFLLYLFSVWFRGNNVKKRNLLLMVIFVIVLFYFFSTSLVYDLVTIDDYSTGILYVPYLLLVVFLLLLIIKNFIFVMKSKDNIRRNQAKIVLLGAATMVLGALLTNAILPLIFTESADNITSIGPFFTIVFTASMTYAIIKHKLFDFRRALARAFSYFVLSTLFILVYITIAFIVKNLLLSNTNINIGELIVDVALMFLLIVMYPKLKISFDRITNKVFFKDSYNSQSFLSELNREIVIDIELESLLQKCANVIMSNLKSSSCVFYIRETAYFAERFIGTWPEPISENNLMRIKELAPKIKKKTISTEDEPQSEVDAELISVLKDINVEVMGRLVSTLEYEVSGIGYIFISQKKSGSSYTNNDLKIIEIVCNELVIATENTLRLEEIEQFNVILQKKIDDATKELQASNDKLKALDEAKDEFVSMASHQLRTPLTSVKGYISMVLEGDAGKINDTQKQMLGQALFSSQRMVYLISDLLNVSRLKTGKFVIEPKPIFLPDLVESEMSQLYEGATAKNITLQYAKPKKFTTVNLDEMKIRQVVMNFTDNAIYYTPNGGKITVELKDKKDSIEFTVKDTGIGVPKAERHKLFEKFYRAENARKARPDGTGLGLFMAKKVIVAQGGSILFDSKEGKGSTFGFSFPKKVITDDTQVHNQSGTPESNQSPEKA